MATRLGIPGTRRQAHPVARVPLAALPVERAIDLTVALLLLAPASLLGLATALMVRFDGAGPPLISQERIGRHGRSFRVFKLRTMRGEVDERTAASASGRIGFFGRAVRRLKLDELPQLWNVLRGEMALVGPRPELPSFARALAADDPLISVRPGLLDRTSLVFCDEERLLGSVTDPERAYRIVLQPLKNGEARRDASRGPWARWRGALGALPCLASPTRRGEDPLRRRALAALADFEWSEQRAESRGPGRRVT